MLQEIREKLILTADDFGKSELANRNILRLAKLGKLDRVSVMSNGNFEAGEIDEIIASGAKLDIHLDLADLPKKERRLKQGVLGRGVLFFLNHIGSPKYRKEEVKKRWISQIESFRKLIGRYPDGLNSHQHIHLFGRYFNLSRELGRKYKIPYFRFAKKGLLGSKTNIRRIIYLLWKKDRKNFENNHFEQPDYFVSLDWIGRFDEFLKKLPEGKTEIACHPEREEEFGLIDKYF